MVLTRGQIAQERQASYQRGLAARAAWRAQQQQQATGRLQQARRWIKRYRPTDPYHRHRLEDDQPKSQHVAAYSRRT